MIERPRRLRRCQLSVPGSNAKMVEKSAALALDYVFLDLEDAVAPSAKEAARGTVVEALRALSWKPRTRGVRINDVTTPWCHGDIIEVVSGAREALDCLILTKAKGPADVLFVDTLLTQLERKLGLGKRIGLEVLVEEVEGLINVEAIARACPRLEALILGMGDYAASQGIQTRNVGEDTGYPGDIWYYPRFKITAAARAAGLDAIDGPFANFRDEAQFTEECRRARTLGMVGKWAIHPSQIDIAQAQFAPAPEEVARARRLVAAYDAALARGEGAIQVEGVMVDVASARILRNVIEQADLIGV